MTHWPHGSFEDQLVLPYLPPMIADPVIFRGGPVIGGGDTDLLRHCRVGRPVDSFYELGDHADVDYLPGEFAYAGPVVGYFGHYMAEMAHRFLPSMAFGNPRRWVMVSTTPSGGPTRVGDFPAFIRQVLDYLRVPEASVQVLSRPTRVERLDIWAPGAQLRVTPGREYLDLLEAYAGERLHELHGGERGYPKVYVSRSGISLGVMLGQRYLEEQLAAEGFFILRPESLPVSRQMDIYRKGEILIFPEGSAAHGAELLGRESLATVAVLSRREKFGALFKEVLEPRSRSCALLVDSGYLGSLFVTEDNDRELTNLGVSYIPPDILVGFLRSHGLARLPRFDADAYREQARLDIGQYREEAARISFVSYDPARVDGLMNAFEQASRRKE